MANLKTLVNYEHVVPYDVTFPNSDRKIGMQVGIRSASSERAKAVSRKWTNDQFAGGKGRQKKYTAEHAEKQELETIASTLAWVKWTMGDPSDESKAFMIEARAKAEADIRTSLKDQEHSPDEIEAVVESKRAEIETLVQAQNDASMGEWDGKQPEMTMELAMEMVEVAWLYSQFKVCGIDVENFMKVGKKD